MCTPYGVPVPTTAAPDWLKNDELVQQISQHFLLAFFLIAAVCRILLEAFCMFYARALQLTRLVFLSCISGTPGWQPYFGCHLRLFFKPRLQYEGMSDGVSAARASWTCGWTKFTVVALHSLPFGLTELISLKPGSRGRTY